MKSTLLVLTLWGCAIFLCAANTPGFYKSYRYAGATNHAPDDTGNITTHTLAPVEQQLTSHPGAKLNYTQIMFEHPQIIGAEEYLTEVAVDTPGNLFKQVLVGKRDASTATMLDNFEFGKKYTWRYCGLHNGKQLAWNGPYSFETLSNQFVDKDHFRVRVLKNDTAQNAGGLIALDMSGNIVDRNGNYVWFLPHGNNNGNENMQGFVTLRNNSMRLTAAGTITTITNRRAMERDLAGNIIWQAPLQKAQGAKSSDIYNYHHCFKRLANNNYMTLDLEQLPVSNAALGKTDTGITLVPFDILNEFNATGKLVWSWHARPYFDSMPLYAHAGNKDATMFNNEPEAHMNAFEVDENGGYVYAGFRNINRVIKIEKSTGKVVCAWGDNMTWNGMPNGEGFFFRQHGTTLLHDGSLAVFNNNANPATTGEHSPASQVVIFTQPVDRVPSAIVWSFDCTFDSINNTAAKNGNVDELKNGNLLVCMGAVNRVFEITRNKQIVWSAQIENRNAFDSSWQKFAEYRAHYTSSLYPCYFTIQTGKTALSKKQSSAQLKIFNDGTEADTYNIDITGVTGNYKKQITAGVLLAKNSISLSVLVPTGGARVTVTSINNPAFKRVVILK